MPASTVVHVTIDAHIKEEAMAICAGVGLTLSDVLRIMLMRTVVEGALPFDPLMPNVDTVNAMTAARRGDLVRVGGIEDLLADLRADD